MSVPDGSVPAVVRLLADPVRWRLMRELASGDQRVRELAAAVGQPQNLVSYHLRQLRLGGLVSARRSSFDGRDTYYSLDLDGCSQALAGAAGALHPGLVPAGAAPGQLTWPQATMPPATMPPATMPPATMPQATVPRTVVPHAAAVPESPVAGQPVPGQPVPGQPVPGQPVPGQPVVPNGARRVLFVCTGNSSRSPMAEGLLRYRAGTRVAAASAGIRPKPVHPHAVAVMRDRYGVDIAGHRPVLAETAARERFDYVISLCDKAREACPEFAGRPGLIHWSLPDPAAGEGGLAGYAAFERTAAELDARIGFLLPVLDRAASSIKSD